MRVRVVIEVPDWTPRSRVFELAKEIQPVVTQSVSGDVVGVLVEEKRSGDRS